MENLILSTIPIPELQALITNSVNAAVQKATEHLQAKENVEFLNRKQAAALLGISIVTLSEWTLQGKIKGYRIGSRIRYKRHEIEQSLLTIKVK